MGYWKIGIQLPHFSILPSLLRLERICMIKRHVILNKLFYISHKLNFEIMFAGIVEESGRLIALEKDQENVHFTLTCSFVDELKVDQSLSHNGVCLTVVEINKTQKTYKVTAIRETLQKSNLGLLEVGSKVNLERSMMMNGRLDGHIVQGHVDQTATCTKVEAADGSWYYTFEYELDKEKARQGYMTVEKGSVTVNGVSLTVVNSKINSFQVAIIPYTYKVTNFHTFQPGSVVNIEFDIIGKYLSKLLLINKEVTF
jgi:riboflavin synthase